MLTWHNGSIPENEIWVKLGGDKGGGSFKMSFQIANVDHPNSLSNTCTSCVYKAGDSITNMHTALDRYQEQIKDLQLQEWQYVYH